MCNFHHFEMTSHKLLVDMLCVRQVCEQCWTHAGLHSGRSQTEEAVCASLQSRFIQRASLFAGKISSAQLRNPPVSVNETHPRVRACHFYSRRAGPLISSLRRVTLYVTCVKTTSMDDERTLQRHIHVQMLVYANAHEHTRMSQLGTIPSIHTHAHAHNVRHTHAVRIDSKSCRASCHGL